MLNFSGKKEQTLKVKILGIGGCGNNIIKSIMANNNKEIVEIVAINTDKKALDSFEEKNKLQIGCSLTRGLAAGADPKIAEEAVKESEKEIEALLENTDMVFLIAGMGGGTGTGATPIIAKMAKQKGILTIAMVTSPFSFEGRIRANNGQLGMEEIRKNVDILVEFPNDRILDFVDKNSSIQEAFNLINDGIMISINTIVEAVKLPGLINLDFSDVKFLLKDKGIAKIAIGKASGENRDIKAAENALKYMFLDKSLENAKSIILNIAGDNSLSLLEINHVANIISEQSNPDTSIMFGASLKEELKDEIVVSFIAAGF